MTLSVAICCENRDELIKTLSEMIDEITNGDWFGENWSMCEYEENSVD